MVWTLTGEPSARLFEAGRALHWALQIPAAFTVTFLPHQNGDAHTNFRWRRALGALCSGTDPLGFRAGLRLHDLTLLLFKDDALYSTYPLVHKTLQEGYGWLETHLSSATGHAVQVRQPGYALPPHDLTAGAAFRARDYKGVAEWYGNASTVLNEVRAAHTANYTASPVRCWPHHFDIATLLALRDTGHGDGQPRNIGVGMTPGDAGIREPYWYVTPWPPPQPDDLPLLSDGRWHTEGWLGAVLTAADLTNISADAQARQVEAFLHAAIAASRALLQSSS